MNAQDARRFRSRVGFVLVVAFASFFVGGCELVGAGEEEERVQIGVAEIQAPAQVEPGAALSFELKGFAVDVSVRVEGRSARRATLSAWAPEDKQDVLWCATPPYPSVGRFETTAPQAGAFVLRFRQPDGTVLEKRVEVEG